MPSTTAGREFVPRQKCQVCGDLFYAAPVRIRRSKAPVVCSNKCRGKVVASGEKIRVAKRCEACGTEMLLHPCRVGRTRFCSKACAKPKERICMCGKKLKPSQKMYCGNSCYVSARMKASPAKSFVDAKCEICGDKFPANRFGLAKGHERFCSRACFAVHASGLHRSAYKHARRGKRADLGDMAFRSSWEANWARFLNHQKTAGFVVSWEYESEAFRLTGDAKAYRPDFKVCYANGQVEFHEIKGYMSRLCAEKLIAMAEQHPSVRVVLADKRVYFRVARKFRKMIPNWEQNAKHGT